MNLVIAEPLGVSRKTLEALAEEKLGRDLDLTLYETPPENDAEYVDRCRKADALIIANGKLGAGVLKALPNLGFLSVAFTGVDHVALDVCREKRLPVSNCAGYSTPAVAELALGLMIAVYRHVVAGDTLTRTGGTRAGHIGRELYGKTLGIVGTGAIGLRTGALAKAFGMSLLACSRTRRPEAEALGMVYKDLPELFEQSDIVSIHVPLNASTRGMIDASLIDRMKPSAVLVNTARGPIVDSDALALALKEGRLSGAGIDVFEMEPPIPSDHPLFTAPNVTVLPHVAFATEEALKRRAAIAFDNVAAWKAGKQINVIL